MSWENLSMGFSNSFDTNPAIQPQSFEILDLESKGIVLSM